MRRFPGPSGSSMSLLGFRCDRDTAEPKHVRADMGIVAGGPPGRKRHPGGWHRVCTEPGARSTGHGGDGPPAPEDSRARRPDATDTPYDRPRPALFTVSGTQVGVSGRKRCGTTQPRLLRRVCRVQGQQRVRRRQRGAPSFQRSASFNQLTVRRALRCSSTFDEPAPPSMLAARGGPRSRLRPTSPAPGRRRGSS